MRFAWLNRFRRAHHGLAYVLAGVLVLMALVGFAATRMLPMLERHPDRVAAWLSERAGRDVRFDGVRTQWTRRGPLLELDNLRIGSGEDTVKFGDAEVLVSQYAGLLPGRSFTELRVRGLELTLERGAGGHWQVRGMPGQGGGADPFASLERLGELQLVGAKLRVLAPALGIDARIPRAHLRLQVNGDDVRAGVRAWMRSDGTPFDGVIDFDRREGNGRAWLAAKRVDLSEWSPLLHGAGVRATSGQGDVQAWVTLVSRRVTQVRGELDMRAIGLSGAGVAQGASNAAATLRIDRVVGQARWQWQAKARRWRLDVPRLVFGAGMQAPRIEGLAAGGGAVRALVAERIDVGPLLAVSGLSDRLGPGLREWLQAARPTGTLRDVRLSARGTDVLQASAQLQAVGFRPAGHAPGLHGVSGSIDGDSVAVRFRPDPDATLVFDWPREYDAPHPLHLRGDILGWREGRGWRVSTSGLHLAGAGYGANVRGGLLFQGDRTRPRIDLAAHVEPAQVTTAGKFWMRGKMAPAAVRWLTDALQGGEVRDGRGIVSGDLDDWPFRDGNGLFHATAQLHGAVVKFQHGWPEARDMQARVDFVADGLAVQGRQASLAGVRIGQFDAGIEHFGQAVLTVDAQASADASQLLALLRQSPLQKAYSATLDQLQVSGPAEVAFGLKQPLYKGGPAGEIDGVVRLDNARLAAKEWKLDFSAVNGTARYGSGGFEADGLSVQHEQRPGILSLRAGEAFVRNAGNAFEGELEAVLSAKTLMERAPDLAWLGKRVVGTSPWTIGVTLPKGTTGAAPPSRLQLRSDLVGTALRLPAPMDKPARVRLPTTIDLALPLERGDVAIAFGQRMALRVRSGGGRTGVRAVLGSGRVPAQVPADGIVATGRSPQLDAIGWAGFAAGGDGDTSAGGAGSGLSLRDVDVTVDQLQLIGAGFPNTRLRAVPAQGGTAVKVEGPALRGAVMLPQGSGGAIAGRFDRVHWRSAQQAGTQGAATSPDRPPNIAANPSVADDPVDPSKVPALNLSIDDFRFGDARLGTAALRTRPVATGMRIEHLATRAPGQAIDVSGDWSGGKARSQTRLDLQLRSQDIGGLLSGLGVAAQVQEGEGSVGVQARWAGSPADFALARLDGKLAVDLRDGQLVKIEPGAGRVLGLFSIMQLPRRLTFDFSDFFDKGFAFDAIKGNVRLAGGSASSDDMVIEGPAAEIRLRGAANLRAQTYDQTIDVYPKAGSLLTVAGAIAGGPVGAAIGAAADAVLNKPIGQLAARRYRVTGPWKDPKVEATRGAGSSESDNGRQSTSTDPGAAQR